jgi:hypothetical protein
VTGKAWRRVLGFKEEVMPLGIMVAPDGDSLLSFLKVTQVQHSSVDGCRRNLASGSTARFWN